MDKKEKTGSQILSNFREFPEIVHLILSRCNIEVSPDSQKRGMLYFSSTKAG